MALPHRTTGSLGPTFVTVRQVRLTVKPAYALALATRFPTALSRPLHFSVTFWRKPPQLNCPASTVPRPVCGTRLGHKNIQGGISTLARPQPGPGFQSLPPILRRTDSWPIPAYSEGPRGLSVLLRVHGIFTASYISPSRWLRQCSSDYAIHARRNLPDKELRYLRTVIVTAAIDWCFGRQLWPCGLTGFLNIPASSTRQTVYILLRVGTVLCF